MHFGRRPPNQNIPSKSDTDTDDNYYEDRDGNENLNDQDGGQPQPATYAVAVEKSSSKRPRNDGSSPSPAPQAKKSANDPNDYRGRKMYQGSMKVVCTSIPGWLSDGGLFRPAPAIKPKADETSFERDDQSKAIMLIYKAHIAWRVVNVEVSPNQFTTLNQLGRERRLDWSEPRYKLLNEEQLSKLNSRLMNDNMFITEDTAAHLRFHKKCEPASSKGKDKGKGKGMAKAHIDPEFMMTLINSNTSPIRSCHFLRYAMPSKWIPLARDPNSVDHRSRGHEKANSQLNVKLT